MSLKGRSTRVVLIKPRIFLTLGLIQILYNKLTTTLEQNLNISEIFERMVLGVLFTNLSPDEKKATSLFNRFTPAMIVMLFVLSNADLRLSQIDSFGTLIICVVIYIFNITSGEFIGIFLYKKASKYPKKIIRLPTIDCFRKAG